MNHVYRLIWNELTATFVATQERTKARGKRSHSAKALGIVAALTLASHAHAAPTGGQVSVGTGAINQAGDVTTITQGSQKLSVNWNSFNIAPNETVNFVQPNKSAIALNRVLGTDGSQILGRLNANGQVFLLNPNGILFGAGSQVNVGGLVASTLHLSDSDFLAGRYSFSGQGGSVINQGNINAADGGYVALIGNQVSNQGTIVAKLGTVAMAAGDQVTLDFAGDSLLNVVVDQAAVNALASNQGLIQADGGLALMTAKAKDALMNTVVNNEGIVQARTVENHNGVIKLLGGMDAGTVKVGGKLDASAPEGGDGGFIDTSGAHVAIDPAVQVTTLATNGNHGTWLIDPNDYKIDSVANNGDMTGAILSGQLGSNNIQILSSSGSTGGNGDIFVNEAVSWSANTTLTLSAYRNIEVNANITATGNTAGLVLTPGTGTTGDYNLNNGSKITLSGSAPSLSIAGNSYTVINDVNSLQAMNNNLAGYYALGSDIDASATSGWNGGAGFVPVGNNTTPFYGAFDGLGHSIQNLNINRPLIDYVGLIGYLERGSTIQNVRLLGGSVNGFNKVGALAGNNSGKVIFSSSSAQVTGETYLGGLVGLNEGGDIISSSASGSVTGIGTQFGIHAGGLVGVSRSINIYHSNISSSYSTGTVSGQSQVGGLVGFNADLIENSYASGNVSGLFGIGGLVGVESVGATIRNSYATGNVSGTNDIGGLVGATEGDSWAILITNTYATGNVSGSDKVGNLIGRLSGTVTNSYATGQVSGTTNVGGLVGTNISIGGTGIVTNSYWDTQTSGQATSAGGSGRTTAQLMAESTFSVWDFTNTWRIYEGLTYPMLKAFMTPLTITAFSDSKTYDGLAYSGGNGVTYSIPSASLSGSLAYTGTSQNAINAGDYVITPGGYFSNQLGYDINYMSGVLTIDKAPLSVTANNATTTYSGLGYSGGNGVSYNGFVNGETSAVLGGTLAYGGTSQGATNAGGYTITPSGLSAGNYTITFNNGTLTIDKAALQVIASNLSKTYGDTLNFNGTEFSTSSLQNGETVGSVSLSSIGAASSAGVAGGPYAITPSSATGGTFNPANYNISYVNGALTITPANLTVAADNITRLYGDANPSLTATATGLKGSDTASIVTGLITTALQNSNVGGYTIDASNATAGANYTIVTATDGTLTIAPAPLVVVADDKVKIFSQPNPPLTATITGFKLGESLAALSGSLLLETTAVTDSSAGDYPITASGLGSSNYSISFVDGVLTILPTLEPQLPGAPQNAFGSAIAVAHTENNTTTSGGRNAGNFLGGNGNSGNHGNGSGDDDGEGNSGNGANNPNFVRGVDRQGGMQLAGLPIQVEAGGVNLPDGQRPGRGRDSDSQED